MAIPILALLDFSTHEENKIEEARAKAIVAVFFITVPCTPYA